MSALAATPVSSPQHDFDFLVGRWQVRNRRLRERLAGNDQWEEFDARVECRPVLGGLGNCETFETTWRDGYRGMALRLFDNAKRHWSIWWSSAGSGTLDAPVVGGFDGDVGNFYGPEMHGDRVVLSRYRWTRLGPGRATWDQAWSTDAGMTWETNWTMQFDRVEA